MIVPASAACTIVASHIMEFDAVLTDVLLRLDPGCAGVPLKTVQSGVPKKHKRTFAELKAFIRARPLKYGLYNVRNQQIKRTEQMVVFLEAATQVAIQIMPGREDGFSTNL